MNYSPASIDEIRRVQALQSLSDEQRTMLASIMVRQTFEAGQLIFLEGDPTVGIWFVVEGRIKIIKQSVNGRVQALCMLNYGKCFGSCPLFQGNVNPASAEAVDRVTVLTLPTEATQALLQREPRFAAALLRIYSQRLAQLARLSESLGSWTAAERINDCLVNHAVPFEDSHRVALTHEKLATLAGTVREVVTRHLTSLEKQGIIRVEPKQITLLDMGTLTRPCLSSKAIR
jgi:CRP/FNR family transcriptional regulator, cyclic AMP receptor protein